MFSMVKFLNKSFNISNLAYLALGDLFPGPVSGL